MNRFTRFWNRSAGAPFRGLARRLSSRLPRSSFDGITLIVGDAERVADADVFFSRTVAALTTAKDGAPSAYSRLLLDVKAVVLPAPTASGKTIYHPIQMAALVPPSIALDEEVPMYAAWLLYASGLSRDVNEAMTRASELLATMPPEQQNTIRTNLAALKPRP